MSDAADRIRKIIADHLGQDVANVVDQAEFVADLGADSLDVVEIAIAVEQDLEVEIDDEITEHMKTVGELVRWVEGRSS